jgi:hypothetical protein
MDVTIGISGIRRTIDGLGTSQARTLRIRVPERFTDSDLGVVRRDADEIAALLRDRPSEMTELLRAALAADMAAARRIAASIGLGEAAFEAKGGGLIWWVVVVVAVGIVLGTEGEAGGEEGSEPGDYPVPEDDDDSVA